MAYSRGTEVELRGTFRDAAGTLADPAEVTLQVLPPGGPVSTYIYSAAELTRASQGAFTKTQLLNLSGPWYYRFQGDDPTIADWKRLDVIDDPLD